jgi:hypothetical protein
LHEKEKLSFEHGTARQRGYAETQFTNPHGSRLPGTHPANFIERRFGIRIVGHHAMATP